MSRNPPKPCVVLCTDILPGDRVRLNTGPLAIVLSVNDRSITVRLLDDNIRRHRQLRAGDVVDWGSFNLSYEPYEHEIAERCAAIRALNYERAIA